MSRDHTHDPAATSWIASANAAGTPFPVQNLPFGRVSIGGRARVVVAIGDSMLDVSLAARALGWDGLAAEAAAACESGALNPLVALSPAHARALRHALFEALRTGSPCPAPHEALMPRAGASLLLPVDIGDYTDFFCSMHHAINASRIFRRPEALRPNYHYLPVGYHGRASSVVVSGTAVPRPRGQILPEGASVPIYAPSRMLDYEVELGVVLRGGNALGETIAIDRAEAAIFGLCLLNDWSARDIQRWENLPLGPFLSRSFATSISPWIVTLDALAPFRQPMQRRPADLPDPPPHLRGTDPATWPVEIDCEIRTATGAAATVATSRLTDMHWSAAQMVAHHASNGCNLRAGDLLGSGTISGPDPGSLGCLLELTEDGRHPLGIGSETRGYLEDGDRVTMTGWCRAKGCRPIGFGPCQGTILPAA